MQRSIALLTILALATATTLNAQTISGVEDEETYTDSTTFTVEDDPAVALVVTRRLEMEGMRVLQADDGLAGPRGRTAGLAWQPGGC